MSEHLLVFIWELRYQILVEYSLKSVYYIGTMLFHLLWANLWKFSYSPATIVANKYLIEILLFFYLSAYLGDSK